MAVAESVSVLESRAQSVALAFRRACVSNANGQSVGVCLEELVSAGVALWQTGHAARELLLEVEAVDEPALSPAEREARQRWLKTIKLTLDRLDGRKRSFESLGDLELAALVASVVDAQLENGLHFDRALRRSGDAPAPVPPRDVPTAHLVLLTLRAVWALDADDAYPGATG